MICLEAAVVYWIEIRWREQQRDEITHTGLAIWIRHPGAWAAKSRLRVKQRIAGFGAKLTEDTRDAVGQSVDS